MVKKKKERKKKKKHARSLDLARIKKKRKIGQKKLSQKEEKGGNRRGPHLLTKECEKGVSLGRKRGIGEVKKPQRRGT